MKVKRIAAVLICVSMMGLVACGGDQGTLPVSPPDERKEEAVLPEAKEEPAVEATAEEEVTPEEEEPEEEYEEAFGIPEDILFYNEEGYVSFIGDKFYADQVEDAEDAASAIYSVIDLLGGDENTMLEFADSRVSEEGVSYYSFAQSAAGIRVSGGAVKLIVDADGYTMGLVSSLVPGVNTARTEEWLIDGDDAEEIVKLIYKDEGIKRVYGDAEQVLLPIDEYQGSLNSAGRFTQRETEAMLTNMGLFFYAWVVYTDNIYSDIDSAYLAHYVDSEGNYLYCLPVMSPGDSDAKSGTYTTFVFDNMTEMVWTQDVTKHDGTVVTLSVPVAVNEDTGEVILADPTRNIVCADYADFNYYDTLTARTPEGEGFSDNELLIYDTFIKVYDVYDDMGWTGPDGEATPSLILMDMVDENGEVVRNAYYGGKIGGFQVFAFNREDPDGECTDVIGHEFTHCVTAAIMTDSLYKNDLGAINEGFSDIMGNILQQMIEGEDADEEWLIGENGNETLRSMSDPHRYGQPEFVWDEYYVPGVDSASDANDNGGVHTNSSLLNRIGYYLNYSGMPSNDQLYFWLQVALAMTPRTDYQQMSYLLPWCLYVTEYYDYIEVMESAIDATGITYPYFPEELPEGYGVMYFYYPSEDISYEVSVNIMGYTAEGDYKSYYTWPEAGDGFVAATVPAGGYQTLITLSDPENGNEMYILYDGEGFVTKDEDELAFYLENMVGAVEVAAGDYVYLNDDALWE